MGESHTCTKDDPWTKEKSPRGFHSSAYEVGEQEDGYPGGDIVTYKCPHCGVTWRSELPQ
jgi:hypothetical protein